MDAREAVNRVIEAFRSDLRALVLDSGLVDVSVVDRVLREAGVSSIIVRRSFGSIVVYTLDYEKIRSRCVYKECSEAGPDRNRCIADCMESSIKDLSESIIRSLEEYANWGHSPFRS